jgi:aspartate-semialdehyde dehydrogenase
MKIGIVGATGRVGEVFLALLESHNFPVSELQLFASEKSLGQDRRFRGQNIPIQTLSSDSFKGLDLVFFSSGDDISRDWAPVAVKSGAFAVDNSAAFRRSHALVVPEINGHLLPKKNEPSIIANPNCSTIQLVMALAPLDRDFGVSEVKVSTYQAVSGAGKAGEEELKNQIAHFQKTGSLSTAKGESFAHAIGFNCIPHIGSFGEDGLCSEEAKIEYETKKIMNRPDLKVSAFTVRVPALNSHSETAWVTLKQPATLPAIGKSLASFPGVKWIRQDKPADYPTPLEASGKEPVFIGRVHQDSADPLTWKMWIVADNLLKGAALNGLQIAEAIFG